MNNINKLHKTLHKIAGELQFLYYDDELICRVSPQAVEWKTTDGAIAVSKRRLNAFWQDIGLRIEYKTNYVEYDRTVFKQIASSRSSLFSHKLGIRKYVAEK